MTWRQRKKFFYGVVFVNIILIGLILILLIFKPKATCFDKKQNQGEEGIDCGKPCISCDVFKLSPLKTMFNKYLIYEDGTMDLIGEVENSNVNYGVKEFNYKFVITGNNGEIREATGKSFILPSQGKYIVIANREAPEFLISSVYFKVDFPRENWQKLENEELPKEVKIDLLNYEFLPVIDSVEVGMDNSIKSIKAEIINSDNFEYSNIVLKFMILDSSENIIGTAISEIVNLEPLGRQTINITLPPFSGIPEKVIFEPEVNLFQY